MTREKKGEKKKILLSFGYLYFFAEDIELKFFFVFKHQV